MMNSVLAQFRSFSAWTELLTSGQAPKYWGRQLFQQTNWLAGVLRSGVWIEEFNQPSLLLLDQPLLGSSLEQLTAQGVVTSAIAEAQTPQLPRHFNHPSPASSSNKRKQNGRTARAALPPDADSLAPERRRRQGMNAGAEAGAVPPTIGRIAKISLLPPRAGESLLRRLAGSAVDDVSNNLGSEANKESARVALPAPVRRTTSPAPFPRPSLPARHLPDWREWQDLVAHRAAENFLRDWPAETLSLISSREVEGLSPSVGGSPLLQEQWITPIDGPAAPAEILIDLARLTEVTGAAAAAEMKWPKTPSLTDNASGSARSEHFGKAEPARRQAGERADGTKPGFRSSNHSEFLSAPGDAFGIQAVEQWREPVARTGHAAPATHGIDWTEFRDSDGSSPESNLAPATLTPSLPPLLPAASPGSPALPMAAAASRYSAWRGEVDAPEKDLNLLAAQMKRILDEEARRHGIDV